MSAVLFDSSVYITALRANGDANQALGILALGASVWLSAVVLEELYAGAVGSSRRTVERLERDFKRAGRILVPNQSDWTETGKILALLASKYGYENIGRGRLTNDALIAMSAGRVGMIVITSNARDFSRLAEFRSFAWRLADPATP
jgi:predicted nucleic acid-binding protein